MKVGRAFQFDWSRCTGRILGTKVVFKKNMVSKQWDCYLLPKLILLGSGKDIVQSSEIAQEALKEEGRYKSTW